MFDLVRNRRWIFLDQFPYSFEGHLLGKTLLNLFAVLHRKVFVLLGVFLVRHNAVSFLVISQIKFNHILRLRVNSSLNSTVGLTLGIYSREFPASFHNCFR